MQASDTPQNTTEVAAPPRPGPQPDLPAAPPPPVPTAPPPPTRPRLPRLRSRPMQFLLFLAAAIWFFVARVLSASAASGITTRTGLGGLQPLLETIFLVFLLFVGFAFLRSLERRLAPLRLTLGIPARRTSRREWATGAAIGWGLALSAILPVLLFGSLRANLWTAPRAWVLLATTLLTLALSTLAQEMAFRGYPFQRLIAAFGPAGATIFMALLFAAASALNHGTGAAAIAVAIFGSVLLSLAWLRTHALWLAWGLHFAWSASTAVLFGLPLDGNTGYASVIETRANGPLWLTGGDFGPDAAVLTAFLLLAAIAILIRATSDFAWDYTRPPLIPGGYDVTIPPPAAHIAMEAAAQPINPASLVQILPATPPPSD